MTAPTTTPARASAATSTATAAATAAGVERRRGILATLEAAEAPLPGTELGKRFGVTRQVIVQDVALLRERGHNVVATNRGYVLHAPADATLPTRLVKVRHAPEETEAELNAVVDLGATVLTVMVNHRTYGRIEAALGVRNRRDVARFLAELSSGASSLLMTVTSGYHFHLIQAESEDVLDEAEATLERLGFRAELTDYEREHFS